MLAKPQPPRIQLPKGWQGCVKSAVLYAIALAHYSIVYARAWAADSINARVRLAAENDRLHQECALLGEELRLKDARMEQIVPQRRPRLRLGGNALMKTDPMRCCSCASPSTSSPTLFATSYNV